MPTTLKLLGNVKGKMILDLGCGSGIYARILTEKGAKVRGIDISSKLLEIAKKEAPKARIYEGEKFIGESPKEIRYPINNEEIEKGKTIKTNPFTFFKQGYFTETRGFEMEINKETGFVRKNSGTVVVPGPILILTLPTRVEVDPRKTADYHVLIRLKRNPDEELEQTPQQVYHHHSGQTTSVQQESELDRVNKSLDVGIKTKALYDLLKQR